MGIRYNQPMVYLYLDESGDLGFDFVSKKPSKFFTITVLAVKGQVNNRAIINAAKNTLKRKLGKKKLFKSVGCELKGSKTSLEVKKYFYDRVKGVDFKLYALTLDKKIAFQSLMQEKKRIYNYIARLVLDQISFSDASVRVSLILDKSKGKPEIADFNSYIFGQITAKIDPKIPLDITHAVSHENLGLQAVDLFSWGIFRKYERNETDWLDVFKGKVAYDSIFAVK